MARREPTSDLSPATSKAAVDEALREQRHQIGQELHDSVAQKLAGLGMLAEALAQSVPEGSGTTGARMRHLANGLDEALSEVRALSHGLVGAENSAPSLAEELAKIAHETTVRTTATCRFEQHQDADVRDPTIARHLCRIAQEAVNNAVRHAQPGTITVALRRRAASVSLEIRDDGRGLPRHQPSGVGFRTMMHRARRIGAGLKLLTGRSGTVVTCSMPKEFA